MVVWILELMHNGDFDIRETEVRGVFSSEELAKNAINIPGYWEDFKYKEITLYHRFKDELGGLWFVYSVVLDELLLSDYSVYNK